MIFSSSAAVYGSCGDAPVSEDDATAPVNPYGRSKLAGELLVRDVVRSSELRAVSLRYFNVAGAGWPELGDTGVTNLVTQTIDRLSRGERPQVYGTDYPTPDGSGVRDYVHVLDLAQAHLAVLDRLEAGHVQRDVFNVGTGHGASVLEVLTLLGQVSGLDAAPEITPRRAGDPASVVAAVDRIRDEVGWRGTARAARDPVERVGELERRTALGMRRPRVGRAERRRGQTAETRTVLSRARPPGRARRRRPTRALHRRRGGHPPGGCPGLRRRRSPCRPSGRSPPPPRHAVARARTRPARARRTGRRTRPRDRPAAGGVQRRRACGRRARARRTPRPPGRPGPGRARAWADRARAMAASAAIVTVAATTTHTVTAAGVIVALRCDGQCEHDEADGDAAEAQPVGPAQPGTEQDHGQDRGDREARRASRLHGEHGQRPQRDERQAEPESDQAEREQVERAPGETADQGGVEPHVRGEPSCRDGLEHHRGPRAQGSNAHAHQCDPHCRPPVVPPCVPVARDAPEAPYARR